VVIRHSPLLTFRRRSHPIIRSRERNLRKMAPRKCEIPRLRYIRESRSRRCLLLDASTDDLKSTTGRGDSFNWERYRDKRINRFSRKALLKALVARERDSMRNGIG